MRTGSSDEVESARIVLSLLESVERDGGQSQRRLASELGIALGLVNSYIKRCVKKGLVKVSEAPARRYAYYLTAKGFAEKSRLTVAYLSHSFSFFRRARSDCALVFSMVGSRGWTRVALVGVSDLAEIACICSLESKIEIIGIVDAKSTADTFVGLPVFARFEDAPQFDGVVVTDLLAARDIHAAAVERFGAERVLTPALLGVVSRASTEIVS